MKPVIPILALFLLHSQAGSAQGAKEETRWFDVTLGVSLGRHNEIEILGYPYAEESIHVRPEFGVAHERTGTFVNLGATKTSGSRDAVGDQVSVSIGWTGDTKRWRLQTDLNRYDVDVALTLPSRQGPIVVKGEERVYSLRFLIESKRECGAPYVWLQEYGNVTAHIVGVGCKWFSVELGGNNGISNHPPEAVAFSRLKVETKPISWLGNARFVLVRQLASEAPFENQTWGHIRWEWDLL